MFVWIKDNNLDESDHPDDDATTTEDDENDYFAIIAKSNKFIHNNVIFTDNQIRSASNNDSIFKSNLFHNNKLKSILVNSNKIQFNKIINNTVKNQEKVVRFSKSCGLILIPCRQEYFDAGNN